jgi:hypothetical protein
VVDGRLIEAQAQGNVLMSRWTCSPRRRGQAQRHGRCMVRVCFSPSFPSAPSATYLLSHSLVVILLS